MSHEIRENKGTSLQDNTLSVVKFNMTDERRAEFQRMAAERAATVMTPEQWADVRSRRADPREADVEMVFSNPRDFLGEM